MLPGAHALQALTPKDLLTIRRGSCVRHRFAKSDCHACFDVCRSAALSWGEDGLRWDAARCNGCLLCCSSCPSGALQASEVSFIGLLRELKDVDQPLIACNSRSETSGHVRVPCLGLLAQNELLLAMGLALGRTIRLNLSGCATCQNGSVVTVLKNMQQKLSTVSGFEKIGIELVIDEKSLDFQERTCNRREFFSLLRSRSKRAGISVVDRLSVAPTTAYGSKQLPVSRQLLLQVLQQRTDLQAGLAAELFPHRVTAEPCCSCTGCVGICPTGALAPPEEMSQAPSFVAERCIGCKLCEDFCPQSGTQIIHSQHKE